MSTLSRSLATPSVVVIVVTYNGKRHLEKCFSSLHETDYGGMRVILIDNGSADDSSAYVAEHFPWVQILRLEKNVGYTRATNQALETVLQDDVDYVMLINDDTRVLHRQWLRKAIDVSEKNRDIGMVGFTIFDQEEEIDETEWSARHTEDYVEVDYFCGCAMLIRANLLRKIGLLDIGYFVYGDDDDLEERARRNGSRIVVVDMPIFHLGGGTTQRNKPLYAYAQMRSSIRMSIKHRSPWRTFIRILKIGDIALNPWSVCFCARDVSHVRMRADGRIFANGKYLLQAIGWNVLHLRETLRARRAHLGRRRLTATTGSPPHQAGALLKEQ